MEIPANPPVPHRNSGDSSTPAPEPKDGDVFRFAYSAESWDRAKNEIGHSDLNWCFDGQLIYRAGFLSDTYWGLTWPADGRRFTVADAQSRGRLEYVCNVNDVEKIHPHEYELYADGDAFDLSHQHGCYRYYVKRRGARKDKARLLEVVHRNVLHARNEVERAVRNLEYAVQRREELVPRIAAGEEPSI